jgi:hypothetical protein
LVGASGSGVRGAACAGTSTANNPIVLAHAVAANIVATVLVDMAHLQKASATGPLLRIKSMSAKVLKKWGDSLHFTWKSRLLKVIRQVAVE